MLSLGAMGGAPADVPQPIVETLRQSEITQTENDEKERKASFDAAVQLLRDIPYDDSDDGVGAVEEDTVFEVGKPRGKGGFREAGFLPEFVPGGEDAGGGFVETGAAGEGAVGRREEFGESAHGADVARHHHVEAGGRGKVRGGDGEPVGHDEAAEAEAAGGFVSFERAFDDGGGFAGVIIVDTLRFVRYKGKSDKWWGYNKPDMRTLQRPRRRAQHQQRAIRTAPSSCAHR